MQKATDLPATLADARQSLELITVNCHSPEAEVAVTLPLGKGHTKYDNCLPQIPPNTDRHLSPYFGHLQHSCLFQNFCGRERSQYSRVGKPNSSPYRPRAVQRAMTKTLTIPAAILALLHTVSADETLDEVSRYARSLNAEDRVWIRVRCQMLTKRLGAAVEDPFV